MLLNFVIRQYQNIYSYIRGVCARMCPKDEETYLGEMFLTFTPLALKSLIFCNNVESNPLPTYPKIQ